MQFHLKEQEEESFSKDDSSEIPPIDIVAYNELRSCADLFRMHKQKILNVNPDFQRDFIWKPTDQTRFIDSLTKQLPIPSMCFAVDNKQQKWIVIDGLQRISTIIRFLSDDDWVLSNLDDIDPALSGKAVSLIREADSNLHRFYTRVENLAVPVTMLSCDLKKKSHLEYLFTIFHRLNTGGVKLNNQEIRNCIYSGDLNILLKKLDQKPDWRKLNKMKPENNQRYIKQELILRFFALYDSYIIYTGRLSKFLNDYMQANQNPSQQYLKQKEEIFDSTVEIIFNKLFLKKPKTLSVTVMESLLVGVAGNLANLNSKTSEELQELFSRLINEPEFSEQSLSEGLAQKKKVIERIEKAKFIFSN